MFTPCAATLRLYLLLLTALCLELITASCVQAQSEIAPVITQHDATWVDGFYGGSVAANWILPPQTEASALPWSVEPKPDFGWVNDPIVYRGQSPIDLDSLSDEELLDLYVAAYAESLQQQTVDQSRLVSPGRLLIEFGYSYGYDADDLGFKYHQHTLPRLGVRYRLSNRIELRAGWTGVTFDTVEDTLTGASESDTNVLNPTLGARFLLWDQQGWRPQSALTVSTPFDVKGDHSFLERFNPQVSLGYGYTIQDDWYLYGSTGAIWANERGTRYLDLQQSVGASWSFHDRWSASLDWYGVFPEGARIGGLEHYLTPGLSYLLTPETLIGIDTSFGLNDNSPDVVTTLRLLWQY